MLDSYRSTRPEHQSYILRARRLRSEAFHTAFGAVAGGVLGLLRTSLQRLKCRYVQQRAEQELRGLHSAVLRDIGVSRSEISFRVREALPCG